MTSTTADILRDIPEKVSKQRSRVAKALGARAVAQTLGRAGRAAKNFLGANKATLLASAGTLVMAAGLSAATMGAMEAGQVEAKNAGNSLYATLMHSETAATDTPHSWHEGGLGGGGLALLMTGGGLTARGLRGRRRQEAPGGTWTHLRPRAFGEAAMAQAYEATELYTLGQMLGEEYKPHPQEQAEMFCEAVVVGVRAWHEEAVAARDNLAAAQAEAYNGFETHMVAGARELNDICGLSLPSYA